MKRTPLNRSCVPVKRKRPGPPRRSSRMLDPAYLEWLRTMPCWGCWPDAYASLAGERRSVTRIPRTIGRQTERSEAAHIGLSTDRRGASQKYSDDTAIPLCAVCHTGASDSIHKTSVEEFLEMHGSDRDTVIGMFQRLYAEGVEA